MGKIEPFDCSSSPKWQKIIYLILNCLNRFAHWIDVLFYFFIANYLYNSQFASNSFGFLVFALPIVQVYFAFKTEFLVLKSKTIVNQILDNERVILFEGSQGKGKSSFMNYLASNKKIKDVYTNYPLKVKGSFVNILDNKILNLDVKVEDYSLLAVDEATLFYHNLLSSKNKGLKVEIYSQEILTQLVRHFFNGWVFYSSVDCGRLPVVIEENASCRLQMLGQTSKTTSFLTGSILKLIGKFFKIDIYSSIRCWDCQQYLKITQENYLFDLSTQEKDSNLNNFSNLFTVVTFNNPYIFDYNDRFMSGVYQGLQLVNKKKWLDFKFNFDLLKTIGYGEVVDFFAKKDNYSIENLKKMGYYKTYDFTKKGSSDSE